MLAYGHSASVDLTPFLVIWLVCGFLGAAIGNSKRMRAGGGFLLGFLLGPVGLIIVAASKNPTPLERVQARPAEAGWHPDPLGRFDGRYFDGRRWTQHVGRVTADGTRQQLEDPA